MSYTMFSSLQSLIRILLSKQDAWKYLLGVVNLMLRDLKSMLIFTHPKKQKQQKKQQLN